MEALLSIALLSAGAIVVFSAFVSARRSLRKSGVQAELAACLEEKLFETATGLVMSGACKKILATHNEDGDEVR